MHPPTLPIGDYLSPLGFAFALLAFGFLRVIVTFTLATVSLLSTAFAKSCKAFVMFFITFTSFQKIKKGIDKIGNSNYNIGKRRETQMKARLRK